MSPLRQLLTLGLLSITTMHSQTTAPPTAPRIEHRETRHGATVIDPYFWLREKTNPAVAQYLEAENAYTEALTGNLKPFSDAIYQEMLGHIKQTDLSVPPAAASISTTHAPKKASNTPYSAAARAAWTPPKKFCSISTPSARTANSSLSAVSCSATTIICWPTPSITPASASTPCR